MSDYCFHCGVETNSEWRFCRRCGSGLDVAPVANRSSFCTVCGNDLASSWRFCIRCGNETPVAKQRRSVHLTPEEMAQLTGQPVGQASGESTAEVGSLEGSESSVELISRRWDVIDLRPVEADVEEVEEPAGRYATPPRVTAPAAPTTGVAAGAERPAIAASSEADLSEYRDPVVLSRLAQLAFLVLGLVAVALVVGLIILNNRLEEFATTGLGGFARVETVQGVVDQWLRPILVGFGFVALGMLVAWTFRVHANLVAFGKHDLRAAPNAAIWSWFVPIVNLILPKQLIDDAWRGSDVYAAFDPNWKERNGNPWLLVLWISALAFVALTVVGSIVGAETIERAMDANAWAMLAYSSLVLACISAVRLFAAVADRQDTRYRGLRGLL